MKRHAVNILIGIGLVSFFLFHFIMKNMPGETALKESLQVDSVSSGILDYGVMGQLMKKLGLVEFADNDYNRYKKTTGADEDLEIMTFQKKRQVGSYLYKANNSRKIGYTSTDIAKKYQAKTDWPVVSIYLDDKNLYDPETGIVANSEKSGRDWEKLAQVTYMKDGQVEFEGNAGLRIHGGGRLVSKKYQPGFKLYFRKRYGLEQIPAEMFFPGSEIPIRTLVLQNTAWPPGYPMNNPIAYDIAREIGCVVPQTRLVEVVLNGKSMGMGFAVEHLSRRQWGQRFGHDNYNFYKFRSDISPEDEAMYTRKFWTIVTQREDLRVEEVGATIDLDNFSRHVFSWVFSGTTDYCQGVAVYDNEDPDAKLSWINWDMDHSFFDLSAYRNNKTRANWQQDAFNIIYRKSHTCGRTSLFTRLMNESDEFKMFFIELMTEIFNHKLTDSFLEERVAYYEMMMARFGQPNETYVQILREYMDNRTNLVLDEAQQFFSLQGPYACSLDNPEGYDIVIDGYPYNSSYDGRYFKSTPLHLSPAPQIRSQFNHWLVNGEEVYSEDLDIALEADTTIKLVMKPSS
ncbi:CotH kinase family protein [Desulfopila sp. IMCC35008]|uniref:CotH kinase family protein n=1 Tax=Desulfopila sp. IMCC35008 TaxID=2653858 RepID=UPI0013D3E545|nr:CotH kinase family protein [Desulfopila sp. IMCC35008]